MPSCDNCSAHVTPDYHRVFKDNNGTLRACPECGFRTNDWRKIMDETSN